MKLPKPDHVPIVGGREVTMACVYVFGSKAGPVKVAACLRLRAHVASLKRDHDGDLVGLFWVPDLPLAKRVAARAGIVLRERCVSGDWFSAPASTAVAALRTAGTVERVPLMTNRDYRKICRSPAARRDLACDNLMRRSGSTGMNTRLDFDGL
jgi:hypothetical protein